MSAYWILFSFLGLVLWTQADNFGKGCGKKYLERQQQREQVRSSSKRSSSSSSSSSRRRRRRRRRRRSTFDQEKPF